MRKDLKETTVTTNAGEGIIVSHLLHPTSHFEHPNDVLTAGHLSEQDKRAILASWASDQYAVESIPGLRHYPGLPKAVSLADILSALRSLDGHACEKLQTIPVACGRCRRIDLRSLVPLRRRVRAARTRT